jgi:hypothetical protein
LLAIDFEGTSLWRQTADVDLVVGLTLDGRLPMTGPVSLGEASDV